MPSTVPIEIRTSDFQFEMEVNPTWRIIDIAKQYISNTFFREGITIQEVNAYVNNQSIELQSTFEKILKANQSGKLVVTLVDSRQLPTTQEISALHISNQEDDQREKTDNRFDTSLSTIQQQQVIEENQNSRQELIESLRLESQPSSLVNSAKDSPNKETHQLISFIKNSRGKDSNAQPRQQGLKERVTKFIKDQKWDIQENDQYFITALNKTISEMNSLRKKNIEIKKESRNLKKALEEAERKLKDQQLIIDQKQELDKIKDQRASDLNTYQGFLIKEIQSLPSNIKPKSLYQITSIKNIINNGKNLFKFSSFYNLLEGFQEITNVLLVCTFKSNDILAFYQPSSITYKKFVKKRQNGSEDPRGLIFDLKRQKCISIDSNNLIVLSNYSVELCRNVLFIEPSNKKNLNSRVSMKMTDNNDFWKELIALGELSTCRIYEVKQ